MADRPTVADDSCQGAAGVLVRPPSMRALNRVAVITMHTSPTASPGQNASGGLNVYVHEVCAAFSDLGIATDVFTSSGSDPSEQAIERLADRSRVIYLPAGSPGLDKYALVQAVEPFADNLVEFARCERVHYDLIYSHYWLSGAVACSLRGQLHLPWAHTAHTLGLVKNRQLARGAASEPMLRIQLEREISRAANLLVASTEAERADLIDLYGAVPDRVQVIAPGVDQDTFQPLPRAVAASQLGYAGQRLLLFVGRLERLKGVEVVLRAFALQAVRRPDVRLLILGEDSRDSEESEKERLRRIARELGILGRVDFKGSVSHVDLPAYYSAAVACLMPSYSESFGLVGLEAQACGCPVIAANVAGLASVVRDGLTGYLVTGDDPADYAERIGRLLAQPELASEMGLRGSQLARRFPWRRTAERIRGSFVGLLASLYP